VSSNLDPRVEDGTSAALSTGASDGGLGQDAHLRPQIEFLLKEALRKRK